MIGFDADQDCSHVAAAAYAKGARFVCRYLGRTTRTEIAALHAAGLAVVLIWETTAQRALSGYQAGMDDGRDARAQSTALGAPATAAIYATADLDVTAVQQAVVVSYFRGFALTGGVTGEYANGAVCQACVDQRVGTYTWLAGGMGMRGSQAFRATGRATIVQDVGDKAGLDLGIAIDSDTATDGWAIGAWLPDVAPVPAPAPSPSPAPPPQPSQMDIAISSFSEAALRLQTLLQIAGLYDGKLEGDWGPASRAALAKYREAQS